MVAKSNIDSNYVNARNQKPFLMLKLTHVYLKFLEIERYIQNKCSWQNLVKGPVNRILFIIGNFDRLRKFYRPLPV